MSTVSNVTVIHLTGNYERSQGRCRGGHNPANKAGQKYHGYTRDSCDTICDADVQCTGYMIFVSSGACSTFTSRNAVGDGRSDWKCYMKSKSSQSTLYNTSPVCFTCFKSYSDLLFHLFNTPIKFFFNKI